MIKIQMTIKNLNKTNSLSINFNSLADIKALSVDTLREVIKLISNNEKQIIISHKWNDILVCRYILDINYFTANKDNMASLINFLTLAINSNKYRIKIIRFLLSKSKSYKLDNDDISKYSVELGTTLDKYTRMLVGRGLIGTLSTEQMENLDYKAIQRYFFPNCQGYKGDIFYFYNLTAQENSAA